MQATAKFTLDRPYFEEAFAEWLGHRSRFRRFQRHVGVGMCAVGLVLAVAMPTILTSALIFAAIGVFEVGHFYWYRARWIRQRLAVRGDEPRWVEMTFDESGIQTNGPTASGHMQWRGLHELLPTERGLFIRLGDSMSIYVPGSAVTPSKADILTLAQASKHGAT